MRVETKRMLLGRSFLAAWLIACFSIAAGQTYPSLKKALTCGTFISLLDGSLKSQMVSFSIPVAAVLPWSDSFLQEYKSGFLKAAFPRTNRRLYVEGKVFSVMTSGFLVWIFAISTILLVNFVIFYPMEIKGSFPKEQFLELLMKALRMGLIGSILSTFGGICGTLWNSAYMAYGIPFVSYYFGIILHDRYFKDQIWFYPVEWILADGNWEKTFTKKPEVFTKEDKRAWLDQMYAPLQSPQNNWGTYGDAEGFNIFELSTNDKGEPMLKHAPLGDASPVEVREAQCVSGPLAVLDDYYGVYVTCPDDAQYRLDWIKDIYTPDMKNDYVYPNVFMSNEDTEQVSNLQADLQTYMNTQKANWIMYGTKDAEWNDYLSKLEAYGLSDYLGIMQKYLDAYYA